MTLFQFAESDKTKPKAVEPRVKPKVKLKAEPQKIEKEVGADPKSSEPDPIPEDEDYIRKLVEDVRTDDEGEAPSSVSPPPREGRLVFQMKRPSLNQFLRRLNQSISSLNTY